MTRATMSLDGGETRSSYGSERGVNWSAAAAALGLQGLVAVMLLSLGIVAQTEKVERQVILSVQARSDNPAPPANPAPAKREVKQEQQPQPKTEVIAPPPKIDVSFKPPAIAAAAEPQSAPTPPVAAAPSNPAPAAPAGGSGPVNVGNLSSNLLNGAAPSYPMGSRRKREEGTVVLRVIVSPEGRVTDVVVQQSSGYPALDSAALAAVRKWRWSPTLRDGRQVSVTGLVRIPFTLRDS